jgi:hypothetical protein
MDRLSLRNAIQAIRHLAGPKNSCSQSAWLSRDDERLVALYSVFGPGEPFHCRCAARFVAP